MTLLPRAELPEPLDQFTASEAMDPCDALISCDSTVQQARDRLFSEHQSFLIVHDGQGHCDGVITAAGLTLFLGRSWFTEHTRIKNLTYQHGPFPGPDTPLTMARLLLKTRRARVLPVVDHDGFAVGVLHLDRIDQALGLLSRS